MHFGIVAAAAAALALTAGCSVNTIFVYRPGTAAPGGPGLSVRVAVLPFDDGTGDFTLRGSVLSRGQYNLAKAGVAGAVTAITPDAWAKAFADELAASGRFASARFAYDASELGDEEIIVRGTVKKAYWGSMLNDDDEFAAAMSAARRADNTVVWKQEVERRTRLRDPRKGCGTSGQCLVNNYHAAINASLQAIFAEAAAGLAAAVGSNLQGPLDNVGRSAARCAAREPAGATRSDAPPEESVEQAIERILKRQ